MKRHKTALDPAPAIGWDEVRETVTRAAEWARKHPSIGYKKPKTHWRRKKL